MLLQYDRSVQRNPQAELPYSLQHQPEVYQHLTIVWLVFNLVRNSRLITEFGIGRISMQDLACALDEFEVDDPDLRVYYLRLLQDLDTAYVSHLMKLRRA